MSKAKITIEADYDRYVLNDNTLSKKMTKSVDIKYLQLIEDVVNRLELMDKVKNT